MNTEINEEKLTAYALGELDDAGRREVEARLASDEAARAEVEQIRGVAGMLKQELAAEPLPEPANAKPALSPLSPPLKLARPRRKWVEHALAACLILGICGVLIAILQPALHTARYSSSGPVQTLPPPAPQAQPAAQDFGRKYAAPQNEMATSQSRTDWDEILNAPPQQSQKSASDTLSLKSLTPPPAAAEAPPAASIAPSIAPATTPPPAGDGLINSSAGSTLNSVASTATPPASAQPTLPQPARSRETLFFEDPKPGQTRTNSTLAVRASKVGPADVAVNNLLPRADAPEEPAQRLKRQAEHAEHEVQFNTESYDRVVDNPFLEVGQNPLSTFSIDVDTASYSNMRRFLQRGLRPPKDSVRIEELVNYFPYDYAPPAKSDEKPFAAHVEVAACPWEPKHRLVRIGLKGKEIAPDKRPASNLVFLIDVSGSMKSPIKLPLVKQSLRMLTEQLGGEDRVAMVVYAGHSGLVLPSTLCNDAEKASVLNALDNLEAGGSTNGGQGIELAYKVAQQNFIEGGTNRVILCTDGDFNVGVTNQGDLTRLIEEKAKGGVFLSVLGFGMGNLKDSTMEKLADKGNGNYGYIDTLTEAKKILVEQMSGTLVTIAKDVKIQVEFNPVVVGSYRLIGYENRMLAKEDFNDDKKDAGEIGAGHAVTALYEVVPASEKAPATAPSVDPLKYQKPAAVPQDVERLSDEMLTLKLRYKAPDGDTSKLVEYPVKDEKDATFAKSSGEFKFASAVAAFGMILRESPHKGSANYGAVLEWAEDGIGKDVSGYRHEFVDLVKRARSIGGGGGGAK